MSTRPTLRGSMVAAFLMAGCAAMAGAEPDFIPIDEDALFGDTAQIVAPPGGDSGQTDAAGGARSVGASDAFRGGEAESKSVGISGEIQVWSQGGLARSYFRHPDAEASSFGAQALGRAALDVRLLRGYKAYADLEWSQSSQSSPYAAEGTEGADSSATWRMPELFLDANIGHRAYFRAGKQVLQWGRGFFFNPTDLVNVERKTFFRRFGGREGVFGLKTHIPFGTSLNLYGFLDAQNVGRPDSLSGAAKIEFLLGGVEAAVMAAGGAHRSPVLGADFSARLWGLDLTGEAALHSEFTVNRLAFNGALPEVTETKSEWAPRAALGMGRSVTVSGVPDRLTLVGEYYYNHPGDTRARLPLPPGGLPLSGGSSADVLSALSRAGFYEPNSYSRHYAAVFAVLSRFLRSDLSLTLNAIANLNQRCALLSGGLSYRDLNDFGISLFVNGFAGPKDTEYTFSEQALQGQLIAEVAF